MISELMNDLPRVIGAGVGISLEHQEDPAGHRHQQNRGLFIDADFMLLDYERVTNDENQSNQRVNHKDDILEDELLFVF